MKPVVANIADFIGARISPPVRTRLAEAGRTGAAPANDGNQTPAVSPAVQPEGGNYTTKQIEDAVERMNQQIQQVSREIQFSLDKSTDRVVIKVIDRQTKEVIRQIPSEEILSLAEHIGELEGVLLKEKA